MIREFGLCFWTLGPLDFEEKCQIAANIGVDGVEIQGDLSQSPSDWRDVLEKYHLKALSVTPENLDISSQDEQVRQSAVTYFKALIPWTKTIGAQRLCLHGEVGKVQGCGDVKKDWEQLILSTKEILTVAEKYEMPVVFEVLNRYENHQITTAKEGLDLIHHVGHPLLSLLLDAYHMNIEESNPIEALNLARHQLGVYHIADSNREGIGNGHADLMGQIAMLDSINYQGPIIMEMTATGPNPFTPVKEGDYLSNVTTYYSQSLKILKELRTVN